MPASGLAFTPSWHCFILYISMLIILLTNGIGKGHELLKRGLRWPGSRLDNFFQQRKFAVFPAQGRQKGRWCPSSTGSIVGLNFQVLTGNQPGVGGPWSKMSRGANLGIPAQMAEHLKVKLIAHYLLQILR